MFRVYVIFRRPTQKNIVSMHKKLLLNFKASTSMTSPQLLSHMQILKDWHLAMYVAVLAIIDIVLLTIVTAIPEARSVGKLVVDQEHPPFRDVSIIIILPCTLTKHKFTYGLLHSGVTGPGGGGCMWDIIYIHAIHTPKHNIILVTCNSAIIIILL